MTVREYTFTVGPETSTLPTIGTPTGDDDLITLGFADNRYTQGSEAVADVATLKAMAEAERRDGDLVLVLDANNLYRFDSASAAAGDDNFVLVPDAGTGRWIRVTTLNRANTFTDTTDSSSKDTGSMILEGGLGVEKSVYIGGNLDVTGDITVSGTTTTLDVTTMEVEDPNILLNRGGDQAGANSAVSGFTVSMSDATDFRLGYDSSLTSKLKAGDSGSESEVITAAGAQTFTGVKTNDLEIVAKEIATPSTPASGYRKIYPKTDGKFYQLDDAGLEQELGSGAGGAGEVNFITNFNAEDNNTDGWATYDDAGSLVDGTGGVSSNVTFTAQSVEILRDSFSFKIAKGAADASGEGVSYDFTCKGQDTNRKLKIQFDFKTNEDAAYASGDLGVYIYDVTNSTLITPVDTSIIRGQSIFQTSFNSTDSTSYRLIFNVETTNASAWDAYIDNVIVGPGQVSQGSVIGPWSSYTPSGLTGGEWGTSTGINVEYRRVGDSIELRGYFTTGTTTANEAQIDLPSGLTIGGVGSDTIYAGRMHRDITTSSVLEYSLLATAGDSYLNIGKHQDAVSSNIVDPVNANNLAGSGVRFMFGSLLIPIAQYQGSGIVPMLSEDNINEWQSYTPGCAWTTNATTTGRWRRVGDSMEIQTRTELTGAPNVATYTVDLPSGYTIDTSKMPNATQYHTAFVGGSGAGSDAGTGLIFTPVYNNTTSITVLYQSTTGAVGTLVTPTTPITWTNTDDISLTCIVPIVEFAGSQNSLVGYAEGSGDNLGLLKKNKWQRKTLASNISTTTSASGTASDLTFNNLDTNNLYRVNLNAQIDLIPVNDTLDNQTVIMTIKNDGNEIGRAIGQFDKTTNDRIQLTITANIIFQPTASTLTFDYSIAGADTSIRLYDDVYGIGTYVDLIELNNMEATTDFT